MRPHDARRSHGLLAPPACRCGEGVHLEAIVGLGQQRHLVWTCDVCGGRLGHMVSRRAVRLAGIDPDGLPVRLSAARARADIQPRLFEE